MWHTGRIVVGMLLVAAPLGCASMSNTEKGVGIGGLVGAGTGALMGAAVGHPGAGAAIGAGVGALGGGLMGHGVDQAEKRAEARAVAAVAHTRSPLGITDVAQMAQQHTSDEIIINQIRTTGSVFQLSPTDITWLKANGVSDAVILEMQASATRVPKRVYSATPVYAPAVYQPVYVVEPPPPPLTVGVGFGYGRRCCW